MHDGNIGTLGGDSSASAYALDAKRHGVVRLSNRRRQATSFIYSGATMTDLNTLVTGSNPFPARPHVRAASAATGTTSSDTDDDRRQTHGFLLTAVATPEPSTLLLAAEPGWWACWPTPGGNELAAECWD